MSEYPRTPCRWCGKAITNNLLQHHERVCLARPGQFEITRQALDDGTGGIVAPDAYRGDGRQLGELALRELFGNWVAVAAAFGLRPRRGVGRPCKPPAASSDPPPLPAAQPASYRQSDDGLLIAPGRLTPTVVEDDRWPGYVRRLLR